MRSTRFATTVAAAAVVLLAAAGCTNSEGGGSGAAPSSGAPTSVAKNDALAAQLPEKIKNAGVIVVGVNVPYAPNEFKDSSGKIVGFDVDLVNAIAATLGVRAEYKESDFAKIIPAVQQGTYDMGMSSFTDSKERQQQVDFVDYFSAGVQWAQQTGKNVDPNNACGLRVAVQSDTVEDTDDIPAKSEACTKAGKPAIIKQKYDSQADATNALVLGRVDAMSADSPVTAYAIKQSGGKIEKAGTIFDAAPYGYPVEKGSPLGPVLQKAVQALIDDGTYRAIAGSWGVQEGAITKSVINGATS
ncbi:ABC transporter substrate-binding protein [Williamsia sp. SKLECPSW1]